MAEKGKARKDVRGAVTPGAGNLRLTFRRGGGIVDAVAEATSRHRKGVTMEREQRITAAAKIMESFAELTGLAAARPSPKRYLWTDAYGVCNFLGLYRETGHVGYRDQALRLVDEVHHVLGRHRKGDARQGWISGLGEDGGEGHPTAGGLRIGKKLGERGPDEPLDENREWDRDGQYFHYLTKWMHALNLVTRTTGEFKYNRWAMELARAAHRGFVYTVPGTEARRMFWKMSTDLSYPLVASMGHHDPLDGLITFIQLEATGIEDPDRTEHLGLAAEIDDLAGICEGREWQTDDLLGLGGLLADAFRVAQLFAKGDIDGSDTLRVILDASLPGLKYPDRENFLYAPARFRLAFRELGLSIGFHALERLEALIERNRAAFAEDRDIAILMKTLWKYLPLGEKIETFWLDAVNQKTDVWKEHRDINMVMLATSLAPDGFLMMQGPGDRK
jgi:hypothetical protein